MLEIRLVRFVDHGMFMQHQKALQRILNALDAAQNSGGPPYGFMDLIAYGKFANVGTSAKNPKRINQRMSG